MTSASHTFAQQLNELFGRSARRAGDAAVAEVPIEQGCPISAPCFPAM